MNSATSRRPPWSRVGRCSFGPRGPARSRVATGRPGACCPVDQPRRSGAATSAEGRLGLVGRGRVVVRGALRGAVGRRGGGPRGVGRRGGRPLPRPPPRPPPPTGPPPGR